jgi:hypothetical protein
LHHGEHLTAAAFAITMDYSNAPVPPPSPKAALEAIAAAQQAPQAPPSSAKRPAALTFDSSNKRPTATTVHTKNVAAPFLLLPSATTPSSAAAARTPSTSSSFLSNKEAVCHNGFFKWAREPHINHCLPDASKPAIFLRFRQRFHKQILLRFKEQRQTAALRAAALSSTTRTRSEAQAILDDADRDAFTLECTDARRLSRLHFEDILRQQVGTPLKMYVSKSAVNDVDGWWGTAFKQAVASQPSPFDTQQLNSDAYYCFDVSILNATLHHDVNAGLVSEPQLRELYDRNEGFSITIRGIEPTKLTISWKQVVEFSRMMFFFGPPMNRTRWYLDLFHGINSLNNIRSIYMWMSTEVVGDTIAAHALSNVYLTSENDLLLKQIDRQPSNVAVDLREESIPHDKPSILKQINDECEAAMRLAASTWIDQHAPLITVEQYDGWVQGVKQRFPSLWKLFSDLRGIEETHAKGRQLVPGKERQVFQQVMSNFRQRNPRCLKWFAMIESISLMASGVGRAVVDSLTYHGSTVGSSTRDRILSSLFDAAQQKAIRECLAAANALIFIIDNFQRGQKLKNQRGGHSSAFLEGTNQIAELAFLPEPSEYDEKRPIDELSYSLDQDYPSPNGMASYEVFDGLSYSSFYAYHREMPKCAPEFTGDRVRWYSKLAMTADMLHYIRQVFVDHSEDQRHMPAEFNKDNIKQFREECKKSSTLFPQAAAFQRDAVAKWNPNADEITPSIFLGLNALEETASTETGAIVLELLEKAGVIVITDDGQFELGDTKKFVILYGDVKTVDNINLLEETIRTSMKNHGMSELQSQLSVFDEALNRVMDLPGDWHAGMSMLQSIVTLFYDVLLYPICHSVLLWKRFNRETNKCYYQSSRLVNVVHQVLMRFTWHRFIGTKYDLLRESYDDFCDGVENEEKAERMRNDSANFLCYCANEFQCYLKAELTCGDQWRQMCSAYLVMSSDFVDFVWAYRKCDSIRILLSYQRFAPVWRVVGATRYLERHWRQLETLYTKFSFRELQIALVNRCSRPFHGTTGKGAHSKDEKMELNNLDQSRYQMPRTKKSFLRRSLYVGVAKKAKTTIAKFHTIKPLKTKKPPRSASKKLDKPQSDILYELFAKMQTGILQSGRKLRKDAVSECAKTLITQLKLKSVEDRMADNRDYQSDLFMSTLRQCTFSREKVSTAGLNAEDLEVIQEEEEGSEDLPPGAEDEDAQLCARLEPLEEDEMNLNEKTNSQAKGYHVHCCVDVWSKGTEMLISDKVKEKRSIQRRQFDREKKMLESIGKIIRMAKERRRDTRLKEEVEVPESDFLKASKQLSKFG